MNTNLHCGGICGCIAVTYVSLRIRRCSKASRPRELSDRRTSRPSMMSNRNGLALTISRWESAPKDRTTPFSSCDRRERLRKERRVWEKMGGINTQIIERWHYSVPSCLRCLFIQMHSLLVLVAITLSTNLHHFLKARSFIFCMSSGSVSLHPPLAYTNYISF